MSQSAAAPSHPTHLEPGKQTALRLETEILQPVRLGYLLYLPQGYNQAGNQEPWPLILFLHGMGERGDDLELVKKHGIPKVAERRPGFPFIAVSPQCPADSVWTMQLPALNALLDEVLARYNADPDRVYLTGLSMGGFGAWHLAAAYPERFAAVVPICGGVDEHLGFPAKLALLKDVPVWAFHGGRDDVVPPERSRMAVDALNRYGGQARLTIYPEAGHDSWSQTYDNSELYDWLLAHRRLRRG